jgi:hypothetical protein
LHFQILLNPSLLIITVYKKLDSLANSLNHDFDVILFLFQILSMQIIHSESIENSFEEFPEDYFLDFGFLAPTAHLFKFFY